MASLVALVVLSPLIGGIALAIRKEDGKDAPVMFTQDRIGINGTHFQMYKFRTMKVDTPHDIPTHLMQNPEQFITKTGKALRKYSLDELPQLVNIFKGDMSFIGPRPALYNQDDLIAAREVAGVHQVPPGLTGFAQCHGRDELPIPEKVRMDAIYLRRIGFKMDASCFFHSIHSVATGEGIVEGALENASEVDMDNPVVPRKVMIITNHSYMLYRFRKELIKAFIEHGDEVVISTPFVGHVEDLKALLGWCVVVLLIEAGCLSDMYHFLLTQQYSPLIDQKAHIVTKAVLLNIEIWRGKNPVFPTFIAKLPDNRAFP